MHEGNEGYPVWSEPTEGLLWHKSHKILMVVMGGMSQSTVHHTLLSMGLGSCRPVRAPMMTPVHRRKHLQWACEHRKWTLEQWKKVAWSDESRFLLDHVDGHVRVHCLPGEVMAPGCTVKDDKPVEGV